MSQWRPCLSEEDAYQRVQSMRTGSLIMPTEKYLLALRKYLFEYIKDVEEKLAEVMIEYEVWDSEYFGKDSDTSEVVYSGTKEKCDKFVNCTSNHQRFTIV